MATIYNSLKTNQQYYFRVQYQNDFFQFNGCIHAGGKYSYPSYVVSMYWQLRDILPREEHCQYYVLFGSFQSLEQVRIKYMMLSLMVGIIPNVNSKHRQPNPKASRFRSHIPSIPKYVVKMPNMFQNDSIALFN